MTTWYQPVAVVVAARRRAHGRIAFAAGDALMLADRLALGVAVELRLLRDGALRRRGRGHRVAGGAGDAVWRSSRVPPSTKNSIAATARLTPRLANAVVSSEIGRPAFCTILLVMPP